MVPTIEDLFEFMRKDKEERTKENNQVADEIDVDELAAPVLVICFFNRKLIAIVAFEVVASNCPSIFAPPPDCAKDELKERYQEKHFAKIHPIFRLFIVLILPRIKIYSDGLSKCK